MRDAKQIDEAEAVLRQAETEFPAYADWIAEAARLAATKSRWDEAIARWREVQKLRPDASQPIAEIAEILLSEVRALVEAPEGETEEPASAPLNRQAESARFLDNSNHWGAAVNLARFSSNMAPSRLVCCAGHPSR